MDIPEALVTILNGETYATIRTFINEEIALHHFEHFIEEDPFLITTPHVLKRSPNTTAKNA